MRRLLSLSFVVVAAACGVWLADCGGGGSSADGGSDATLSDGNPFGDGSSVSSLTIQPQNPTVPVTITDGVVTTTPITFIALANGGAPVAASFTLDHGELGNLDSSTGVFTASGNVAGVGTVTASYSNGTSADGGAADRIDEPHGHDRHVAERQDRRRDAGRRSGSAATTASAATTTVDPVDPATKTVLDGPATAPRAQPELGFLYPYDKTVWPQGILAPLLQWQSTHASVTTAVKIHLAEQGFTFDGYYTAPGWVNEPIDESAWSKALYGNQGDPLEVDLYITDGTTNWGPITEHWTVASRRPPGHRLLQLVQLQLTGSANGAVLAIKPGAIAPTLAIPGSNTACHVCHEVSANGSTLFMTGRHVHDGGRRTISRTTARSSSRTRARATRRTGRRTAPSSSGRASTPTARSR